MTDKKELLIFKSKMMDNILLFMFLEKVQPYHKEFYFKLKDAFIEELKKDNGSMILINDLNLNDEDLKEFLGWFNYFDVENTFNFEL